MIFGFAKKLGLCETAIYCIGDWLVSKQEKNWIKYIGNNILWLAMDYIAASLNSVVIHNSRKIYLARNSYWGRKVIENEVIQFPPPININPNATDEKRFCIGFIGQVLENSGLELILPHLRTLNQKYGIQLKIAGPNTPFRGFIEQEIKRHDLGNIVELNGFIDLEEMYTFLNICFCGINLIKSEDSHSTYTIPGKLIQYLQGLTPILVTKHNGDFVQVTQENNLGLVIKPESQYIVPAIENLFKNQKEFRKNINCYASKQSIETVSEYISSCESQRSHR